MNFSTDKAIYIQIADRLCDEILTGKYVDDGRIPSVREYSVSGGASSWRRACPKCSAKCGCSE